MTHKNVLVMEDNKNLLLCYKGAFDRYKDITYDLFDRGSKVLSALINNYYDIIVLDYGMPDIDGIEVCKTIRKDKSLTHSNKPIIICSASADCHMNILRAAKPNNVFMKNICKTVEIVKTFLETNELPVDIPDRV